MRLEGPFEKAIREGRLVPFTTRLKHQHDYPRLFPKEQGIGQNTAVWMELAIKGLFDQQSLVFRTGDEMTPHQDCKNLLFKSFYQPDADNVYYALNIPMKGISDPPPAVLIDKQTIFNSGADFQWMGNITPQFTKVGLHLDSSQAVYSVTTCPKDWVLYEPTPENLNAFYKTEGQRKRYERVESALTGGQWLRQAPDEGIYVPPGWLHATYTQESGTLAGTTWVYAEALPVITSISIHEREQGSVHSWDDVKAFLFAFLQALRSELTSIWEPAIKKLCGWDNTSKALKHTSHSKQLFKEIKEQLTKQGYDKDRKKWKCPKCTK